MTKRNNRTVVVSAGSDIPKQRKAVYGRKDKTGVMALIDALDPDSPAYAFALRELFRLRMYVDDITPEMVERVLHRASGATEREAQRQRERTTFISTGRRSSVVYYARIADQIKIGTTKTLQERMTNLGIEEVMATEPGGPKRERMRHGQFAGLHLRGEWFRYESPLTEWIERLRAKTP